MRYIKTAFSYLTSFVMSFIIMTAFWVVLIIVRETFMHSDWGATIVVGLSALAFMPKYRKWRGKLSPSG